MAQELSEYLKSDAIVETAHPGIKELAAKLRAESQSDEDFAARAFNWVRDNIDHSVDVGDPRVTIAAGEVLTQRVGLSFAKAHLLVAIMRSAGIPAGFCYQRLRNNGSFALHGLMAVYLADTWHRQDPRGGKSEFSTRGEKLAYQVNPDKGEVDYPTVFVSPAPVVVQALAGSTDVLKLCSSGLPEALPD